MSQVLHRLYVNADAVDPRSSLVYGTDNLAPKAAPRVVLGDTMQLHVYLLNSDGSTHEAAGNSNYLLTAAIGSYAAGKCAYTTNFYASASAFTGSMELNTVALSNLLNGADSIEALFEIQVISLATHSGSISTVVSTPIIVSNQLLDTGGLTSGSLSSSMNLFDSRYVLRNEMLSASGWIPVSSSITYTMRDVGIGTANPQADLHVIGNAIISSNISAPSRQAVCLVPQVLPIMRQDG
jgi:hypothetical protein